MTLDLFSTAFQPSPGQSLPDDIRRPYELIGSADGEAARARILQASDQIRPAFSLDPDDPNSFVSRFGEPEGFDTPPGELDRATFLRWHSQVQLEYIYKNLTDKNAVLPIGAGATINVMISPVDADVANPGNLAAVINIDALTASRFGQLSSQDQQRVLANDTFREAVLPGLGLTDDLDEILDDPRNPLAQLRQVQDDLNNPDAPPGTPSTLVDALQELAHSGTEADKVNANAALDALKQQIDLLFTQINASSVFDAAALNTAAGEILRQAEALSEFAFAMTELNAGPTVQLPTTVDEDGNEVPVLTHPSVNAQSLDDQKASLAASFANFVRAESAKSAALEASNRIAQGIATDDFGGRLDGPGLMAAFVFNLSLKLQAITQADTERFNQLSTLVKSYGVMQELINRTLAEFDATDTDQRLAFLGLGDDNQEIDLTEVLLTPEERAALSMFFGDLKDKIRITEGGDVIWENGHFVDDPSDELKEQANVILDAFMGGEVLPSPLENLENVSRPELDIGVVAFELPSDDLSIKLPAFDRQHWSTLLQQVNDAVTLLNQSSQLAFNKITSQSQQRTTFVTTASDALAKASDVLQSITRNIA